jgi:hypothetical protein
MQAERADLDGDFQLAAANLEDLSGEDDDADEDSTETLSVHDAADIWLSNGMDEDYTFGYTAEELQRAAEE